jgi:hypothetical protein
VRSGEKREKGTSYFCDRVGCLKYDVPFSSFEQIASADRGRIMMFRGILAQRWPRLLSGGVRQHTVPYEMLPIPHASSGFRIGLMFRPCPDIAWGFRG